MTMSGTPHIPSALWSTGTLEIVRAGDPAGFWTR